MADNKELERLEEVNLGIESQLLAELRRLKLAPTKAGTLRLAIDQWLEYIVE